MSINNEAAGTPDRMRAEPPIVLLAKDIIRLTQEMQARNHRIEELYNIAKTRQERRDEILDTLLSVPEVDELEAIENLKGKLSDELNTLWDRLGNILFDDRTKEDITGRGIEIDFLHEPLPDGIRLSDVLMEYYLNGDGTDDFGGEWDLHLLTECASCRRITDKVDDAGLDELGKAAVEIFKFADGERRKNCPQAFELLMPNLSDELKAHMDCCKLCQEERNAVIERRNMNEDFIKDFERRKKAQEGN